ncbi:MAG TPA: sigma-54 dependent transcriptional regulator [Candidatus Polarisedimenticolaceae bacterium]|nr:sigma-54 dependent transcriptional regulator [Candidatus Polarisedimenticolaceae bacterium]
MRALDIVLADAAAGERGALARALQALGHRVTEVADQRGLEETLAASAGDLVLVDTALPPTGGIAAVLAVKRTHPSCPVALGARAADVSTVLDAFHAGAYDVLAPPAVGPALDRLLARAAAAREMGASRRRLAEDLETERRRVKELAARVGPEDPLDRVLGTSPAMRGILAMLREVARTDATVLLPGESGTGTGLVARAIHAVSPRAQHPFVDAHCAAYSEGLLHSELFGHERGAFTGADRVKLGRFELADGGTLFLDEIGDLSMTTQLLLLRVLQQRTFERVGGEATLRADVRLIAATHRDLPGAIREGTFRSDLYYRLNVIPVHLPPLRERREDVAVLADAFLRQSAARLGRTTTGFGEGVLGALEAHDWPGNVRELENLLERLLVLSPSGTIELSDLPTALRPGRPSGVAGGLLAVERRALEEALAEAKGNKKLAARRLGLHRSTFYAKLRRHGLHGASAPRLRLRSRAS